MKRANHNGGALGHALRLLTLSLMAAVCASGQEGRKVQPASGSAPSRQRYATNYAPRIHPTDFSDVVQTPSQRHSFVLDAQLLLRIPSG